jgi:Tol biopolymer transport system component
VFQRRNAGVRSGHIGHGVRTLVWVDEAGRTEAVKLPSGAYQEMRISPDGTRVALLVGTSGNGDVWIHEFARGTFSRLTFTGTNAAPTWSADGRSVYYSAFDASTRREEEGRLAIRSALPLSARCSEPGGGCASSNGVLACSSLTGQHRSIRLRPPPNTPDTRGDVSRCG